MFYKEKKKKDNLKNAQNLMAKINSKTQDYNKKQIRKSKKVKIQKRQNGGRIRLNIGIIRRRPKRQSVS